MTDQKESAKKPPVKKENKTKFTNGFYRLTSSFNEETIAYFYYNPDAELWGFGFNISDGGGFIPAFDLTEKTEVKKLEIDDGFKDSLTGSEAVYGFAAWLTSRSEKTVMSSSDDCSIICELIDVFCKVNGLKNPRENYADYLTHPTSKN